MVMSTHIELLLNDCPCPQLATSFDGFCIFRPAEYEPSWATQTGWYHLDQNGVTKPDKVCVQGFINYYDSGEVRPAFRSFITADFLTCVVGLCRPTADSFWCHVPIWCSRISSAIVRNSKLPATSSD